jgi:hypothetical protein
VQLGFWFTVYDSDGPDGLPGTVLLRGLTGFDPGFVAARSGDNYTISFPPFVPLAHRCYYFSIAYPQEAGSADPERRLRFAWGNALPAANPLSNFSVVSRTIFPLSAWRFQQFGSPHLAEASMVFDLPAEYPSCGAPPPIANDTCLGATAIVGTGTFAYDNRGATTDGSASCDPTSTHDAWYRWLPTCTGTYTIAACGLSTSDLVISALTSCAGPELACNDDGCGTIGGPGTITVPAVQGTAITIRIATFGTSDGDAGLFTITRADSDCPPPPTCCDFNTDQFINSQDFFDFLVAFFSLLPLADFNRDQFINTQDFFDFVACYFQPPPGCPAPGCAYRDIRSTVPDSQGDPPDIQLNYDYLNRTLFVVGSIPFHRLLPSTVSDLLPELHLNIDRLHPCTGLIIDTPALQAALNDLAQVSAGLTIGDILSLQPKARPDIRERLQVLHALGIATTELATTNEEAVLRAAAAADLALRAPGLTLGDVFFLPEDQYTLDERDALRSALLVGLFSCSKQVNDRVCRDDFCDVNPPPLDLCYPRDGKWCNLPGAQGPPPVCGICSLKSDPF